MNNLEGGISVFGRVEFTFDNDALETPVSEQEFKSFADRLNGSVRHCDHSQQDCSRLGVQGSSSFYFHTVRFSGQRDNCIHIISILLRVNSRSQIVRYMSRVMMAWFTIVVYEGSQDNAPGAIQE